MRWLIRHFWWFHYQWLELKWWFQFTRPARDLQIKIKQEVWEDMPDEKWGQWVNRLTWNEFFAMCCMRDPDTEEGGDEDIDDDDLHEEIEQDEMPLTVGDFQ